MKALPCDTNPDPSNQNAKVPMVNWRNGRKRAKTKVFLGPNPALVMEMPRGVNKLKNSKISSIFFKFSRFFTFASSHLYLLTCWGDSVAIGLACRVRQFSNFSGSQLLSKVEPRSRRMFALCSFCEFCRFSKSRKNLVKLKWVLLERQNQDRGKKFVKQDRVKTKHSLLSEL